MIEGMKQALLVVDHGSKRKEANDMIFDLRVLLRSLKPNLIIHVAHMELAEPDIATGLHQCVVDGAAHIVVQPFMLSPGRHSTKDIPDLVEMAMKAYPSLTYHVSEHFGVHNKLAELIFEKSGFN